MGIARVAAVVKPRIEPASKLPEGCSEEITNCEPFISASDFNYVILKYKSELSSDMRECLARARDELQNQPPQTWHSAEIFVQGKTKAFKFISGDRSNVFVCYKPGIGLKSTANGDVGSSKVKDAAIIYCEKGADSISEDRGLFAWLAA